jgi:hypothetical protein
VQPVGPHFLKAKPVRRATEMPAEFGDRSNPFFDGLGLPRFYVSAQA